MTGHPSLGNYFSNYNNNKTKRWTQKFHYRIRQKPVADLFNTKYFNVRKPRFLYINRLWDMFSLPGIVKSKMTIFSVARSITHSYVDNRTGNILDQP